MGELSFKGLHNGLYGDTSPSYWALTVQHTLAFNIDIWLNPDQPFLMELINHLNPAMWQVTNDSMW